MIHSEGMASWHGFFLSCRKTGAAAITGSCEAKRLLRGRETLIFSASESRDLPRLCKRQFLSSPAPLAHLWAPLVLVALAFSLVTCILVGSVPAGAISIISVC